MDLAIETREAFRFLEDEYGFVRRIQERGHVRYDGPEVSVSIWLDRGEIDVTMEPHGDITDGLRRTYTVDEILLARGIALAFGPHATSAAMLGRILREYAEAMWKHLDAELRGDTAIYQAVEEHGRRWFSEYLAGVRRAQADEAWQNRDFEGLCRLYEADGPELTAFERRWLEYARKKIQAIPPGEC